MGSPMADRYAEVRALLSAAMPEGVSPRVTDASALIVAGIGGSAQAAVTATLDIATQLEEDPHAFGVLKSPDRFLIAPLLLDTPISNHTMTIGDYVTAWKEARLRADSPGIELGICGILAADRAANDGLLLSRVKSVWSEIKAEHFWRTGPSILPSVALVAARRPDALIGLADMIPRLDRHPFAVTGRIEGAVLAHLIPVSPNTLVHEMTERYYALVAAGLRRAAQSTPMLVLAGLVEASEEDLVFGAQANLNSLSQLPDMPGQAQRIALGLTLLQRPDPLPRRTVAFVLAQTMLQSSRQVTKALQTVATAAS